MAYLYGVDRDPPVIRDTETYVHQTVAATSTATIDVPAGTSEVIVAPQTTQVLVVALKGVATYTPSSSGGFVCGGSTYRPLHLLVGHEQVNGGTPGPDTLKLFISNTNTSNSSTVNVIFIKG